MQRLTRVLSFVLRHRPSSVAVVLDEDGWTDLHALIQGLRQRPAWTDLSEQEVHGLLEAHTYTRFQINEGRVRALYGHSLRHISPGTYEKPPALLFHSTKAASFNAICHEGIAAKGRSHAHLTSSFEYAFTIKEDHERSGSAAIVFGIQTAVALKGAIPFYRASEVVWTAPYIPPSALLLVTTRRRQLDSFVLLPSQSESALFSDDGVACFGHLLSDDDGSL